MGRLEVHPWAHSNCRTRPAVQGRGEGGFPEEERKTRLSESSIMGLVC